MDTARRLSFIILQVIWTLVYKNSFLTPDLNRPGHINIKFRAMPKLIFVYPFYTFHSQIGGILAGGLAETFN